MGGPMRRGLAAAVMALALMPFAWTGLAPHKEAAAATTQVACGAERWGVKTLTDPLARKVNLTAKATTVSALRRLPVPLLSPRRARGVEMRTFQVRATLVEMKLEDDSDIHLVIADPRNTGRTMIVELPDPGCTVGALPA